MTTFYLIVFGVSIYSFIAGCITCFFTRDEKGFWVYLLSVLFGVIWPLILITSFFIPRGIDPETRLKL